MAYPNSSLAVYGTVLEYTCMSGYKFPGTNSTTMGIECMENEQWNDTLPNCEGKFKKNGILMYLRI